MVTFFILNPEREVSSISILVTFNGKKYRRSVRESVSVDMWNNEKKRVRVTQKNPQGNLTNDTLMMWEAAALRTMSHFKAYFNPPSKEEFFSMLDKEFYKDEVGEPEKTVLFLDYFITYIERYQSVRDYKTIKKYVTARNKLRDYEKSRRKRLMFSDINIDFYNDFRSWFYSKKYSDNYFGSVIKVTKQVYVEARVVDKLHTCNDIEHKDFITVAADSDSVYLSEAELLKIHRLDLTHESVAREYPKLSPRRVEQKLESLTRVRPRFLIGAYTGLRVSDFSRLGDMNIGEFIRINAIKSKLNTVVPIHPVVQEILDAGFDAKVTISDQKINKHVKELARLAGITEKVLLGKHVGGKVEEVYGEKCDFVGTHTARRSFATNAYKAGVPTISIMKITGHKKESTFLKYIKISADENAEMLKNHPFFGGGTSNKE